MRKQSILIAFTVLLIVIGACSQKTNTVWFDDLPIQTFSEGIRPVIAKASYGKGTLCIHGKTYSRGLGAITPCVLAFSLEGKAKHFSAEVGADDLGNKDVPLKFYVVGDQKVLFESREMRIGDVSVKVDVDLTGINQLGLLVTDPVGGIGNKKTYANWTDAKIEMIGTAMPGYVTNKEVKYILTPELKPEPKINSAKRFGATPGNPILYTIAATGNRPMQFSAENLPSGLTLNPETGIILGKVSKRGTYQTILHAKNALGEATQKLILEIGDPIALTPPMGWNGWNSWESNIDKEKVIASANAMVNTGLRNHGWNYINIDDTWQGKRGGKLNALQPNEKFPDMKEMVDYIHSLGLKAGLYSTPYISSYGSYVGGSSEFPNGGETHDSIKINKQPFMHIGKYRFETNDAKQMAEWGFDFLKYDWRIDVESTERMSDALKKSGRDMIFSLSNNSPFEKVEDWKRLSNMYRTGPDIKDSWTSLFLTTFSLEKWSPYSGPGHWADPDMMIVGKVSIGSVLHDTRLSPDEQYSHVSIFCLLAAPLLIGCPIDQLDKFTLNLLTNDEVIEVNQDPLGKSASLVADEDGVQIWLKPMEDGSYAIGLFNIDGYGQTPASYFHWGNETPKSFTFNFSKVSLTGKWLLRDVWRQKDLGEFDRSFNTEIPHHGVVLLRAFPADR
jgi:alpha-galactosidase